MYGFRNIIVCQFCRSSNKVSKDLNSIVKRTLASKDTNDFSNEDLLLFFKSEVQTILKKLTGFDMQKVLSKRKLGERLVPPKYQFMTSQEVEKALRKARKQAEEMLQMPPVVPIRKEIDTVLSKDTDLIGYDNSKYIFTDISFGKSDRTRTILVRDLNGYLRKAYWSERRNANQTYFPRPGRQFYIPQMFKPEFLKPILERGDYIFILDRACVEYDADDPEYHRVTQTTYKHIDEKQAFGVLRFTRHFGPMVFYLALTKNIDNLLLENLKTDRLEDAVALITLFHIVHPSAQSAGTKPTPVQEIAFIKNYVDKDANLKVALELALMECSQSKKLSEAVAS